MLTNGEAATESPDPESKKKKKKKKRKLVNGAGPDTKKQKFKKKAPRLLQKQKTVWKQQTMRRMTVRLPACPLD